MDWLQSMNNAINYIEDNLLNEIDYEKVAKLACCSQYHFQRMFSFITGVPLSEYIRRRRLTLAAFELQNSDCKIIDLAYKYGYDSPNSFTRAFQVLHGVTPSSARDLGVNLKAYPRMSFHITIKGDIEMDYKICKKDAFSVFGVETVVSAIDGKCFSEIPDFWYKCINDGTMERILKTAGSNEELRIYDGLCGDSKMLINAALYGHNPGDGTFKYMVCLNTPKDGIKDTFKTLDIPASTWVIFTTGECTEEEQTEAIQSIWKRIFPEWFPTSGYEHADCPEFEMNYRNENGKFISEVWIPVIKK